MFSPVFSWFLGTDTAPEQSQQLGFAHLEMYHWEGFRLAQSYKCANGLNVAW